MRLELLTSRIIPDGCFSILKDRDSGAEVCHTCERTFDDGRPVIPAGEYLCKRTKFKRGGYWTFEITGVEGHSGLKFHKGNLETESLGCPLVGMREGELAVLDGKIVPIGTPGSILKPAVVESGKAFDKFTIFTQGVKEFWLKVSGR